MYNLLHDVILNTLNKIYFVIMNFSKCCCCSASVLCILRFSYHTLQIHLNYYLWICYLRQSHGHYLILALDFQGKTFCSYKLYLDKTPSVTQTIPNTINPNFSYSKRFTFSPVTKQVRKLLRCTKIMYSLIINYLF